MARYVSFHFVVDVEITIHYPVDFLHALKWDSSSQSSCQELLWRTSNLRDCTNTRLQVVSSHIIEEAIFIHIAHWKALYIRFQFLVKVCYAITVHKAHGWTQRRRLLFIWKMIVSLTISSLHTLSTLQPDVRTSKETVKTLTQMPNTSYLSLTSSFSKY